MTKLLQRKIARVNKQGNDAGSALALIRSLAEGAFSKGAGRPQTKSP